MFLTNYERETERISNGDIEVSLFVTVVHEGKKICAYLGFATYFSIMFYSK